MKNKKVILVAIIIFLLGSIVGIVLRYRELSKPVEEPKEPETPTIEPGKLTELKSLKDFNDVKNKKENNWIILGKKDCPYCELYKEVLDRTTREQGWSMYYIEVNGLPENEFHEFMHSDLVIPAKCSPSGEDKPIQQGFGTPLNLFMNNGKIYDCMRGYYTYDKLIEKMKTVER